MLNSTFCVPPDLRPAPILATWSSPKCTVTFSQPLTPGPLNPGNWFVRVGDRSQTIFIAAAVAPNTVELTSIGSGPNPGPDVVSYSPPPFDVTGPTGDAQAFADYPIT